MFFPPNSGLRRKPAGTEGRTAVPGLAALLITVAGFVLLFAVVWPRWLGPRVAAWRNPAYEQSDFAMDTFITVKAYGPRAEAAVRSALAEFRRVDRLLSAYDTGSEVSQINRGAGRRPTTVSRETMDLLRESLKFGQLTGGVFDVTVGPLVKLWGVGSDREGVPAKEEIRRARSLVDFRKVRLAKETTTAPEILLAESGMLLDLGAVAKGYAAERAREILRAGGVRHALVDAGGNIVALGARPDGRPWQVGIRHPRKDGEIIGVVLAKDVAVVTSGDYERYFETGGRRYHHILDPRTGFPASGAMSATVVATSSTEADLLSTSLFILGPARGSELLARLGPGRVAGAIFVDARGRVLVTEGLLREFRPAKGIEPVVIKPKAGPGARR